MDRRDFMTLPALAGIPNWLDTQSRPTSLVYWRFIFLDEPVQPPAAKVVPVGSLKG